MGIVGAPHMTSQPVFSTALWDLANSRPFHDLMLSSHLFFCLPCLLPPFIVPCKMVLARSNERETHPYRFSLHLFTMVRSSCGLIASIFCMPIITSACWKRVIYVPRDACTSTFCTNNANTQMYMKTVEADPWLIATEIYQQTTRDTHCQVSIPSDSGRSIWLLLLLLQHKHTCRQQKQRQHSQRSGLSRCMTSFLWLSITLMSNGREEPQQLRVQQHVSAVKATENEQHEHSWRRRKRKSLLTLKPWKQQKMSNMNTAGEEEKGKVYWL